MKKRMLVMATVFLGMSLALGFLGVSAIQAALTAPQAELHVCASGCPYSSIQAAVDAANPGDVIKIAAGTYTGVSARSGVTQTVYIDKSLTLRGGYSTDFSEPPDPNANPTTLDAQGLGRVLYITLHDQVVTIEGLRLVGGDASRGGSTSKGGGGLYALGWLLPDSAITLANNEIIGNSAGQDGGGINLWGLQATLTGNSVISNTSQDMGGGIILFNTVAHLSGNLILSNTASMSWPGAGGGLDLHYSTATLTGNTFRNNRARDGGGINVLRSPLTLKGNQFIANAASDSGVGGGINYGGTNNNTEILTATNNTFVRNSADSGGGAFLQNITGTLSQNVFDSNTASEYGGGLVAGGDNLTLDGNHILSNTATFNGGGLSLSGDPVLSSNLITGNVANKGGGIYSSGFGNSSPHLVNNVFADNRLIPSYLGIGWGSAIYLNDSSADLLHTTLARNTGGDGSGLYITNTNGYYGTTALTNTIIADQPVGIQVSNGNTAIINGILWFNTPITLTAGATAIISVQNQYTGDPRFDLDGYHIQEDSAAVDKGVAAGVTTDIDKQPRPNGSAPDLGADEWYPPMKYVYLPIVTR